MLGAKASFEDTSPEGVAGSPREKVTMDYIHASHVASSWWADLSSDFRSSTNKPISICCSCCVPRTRPVFVPFADLQRSQGCLEFLCDVCQKLLSFEGLGCKSACWMARCIIDRADDWTLCGGISFRTLCEVQGCSCQVEFLFCRGALKLKLHFVGPGFACWYSSSPGHKDVGPHATWYLLILGSVLAVKSSVFCYHRWTMNGKNRRFEFPWCFSTFSVSFWRPGIARRLL